MRYMLEWDMSEREHTVKCDRDELLTLIPVLENTKIVAEYRVYCAEYEAQSVSGHDETILSRWARMTTIQLLLLFRDQPLILTKHR